MMNNNWKEYTLNGITITLHLDTKRHVWKIWFGSIYDKEPDLEFTKAKGACIVEFLEKLKEIQRNANRKEMPNV